MRKCHIFTMYIVSHSLNCSDIFDFYLSINGTIWFLRVQPTTCDDKPVATLLMAFSRGCNAVLNLMQVSPGSPCNSDGYHSEPEVEIDSG